MKAAELCAGYGGLALAVEQVFGAETAWFSEFEAAPSRILAHHWHGVPNHGDMTTIDWSAVEPVDIISGGTPCQDLSHAGRRAGMTDGTRSNLWVQMRESIAVIKPTYVIWENVRGAYSASADSDLEHCAGCMGDAGDSGPVLRALGRVLGDLSDLGYDAQWRGLRAADVGAPHGRFRVFVLATRRDAANDPRCQRGDEAIQRNGGSQKTSNRAGVPHQSDSDALRLGPIGEDATDAISEHRGQRRNPTPDKTQSGRTSAVDSGRSRTPTTTLPAGIGGREGRAEHARIERRPDAQLGGDTPTADADSGDDAWWIEDAQRIEEWREATAGISRGHSIPAEPRTYDKSSDGDTNWGDYTAAIRRWERTLVRRAPRPTEPTGRNGAHRLSARFAEWMMGCPDGWIVDVPGVSRNEALKAAGNGVITQQAVAALKDMLHQPKGTS